MKTAISRLLTGSAVTIAALIGFAPAAAAHVAVDSADPNGDGTTTVTLVWDHSCTPGTPTTGVTVSAGSGVEFTGGASDLAGWSASVDPATVAFNGPAVPTGQKAAVTVTARITANPGTTVEFPAVQYCSDQQTAWTDPDPAAEHPSPMLIATAAIAAPAAAAAQVADAGADLGQVLTGVLLLAGALAAVGVVVVRRGTA
jgi:uncharacterized protein YcnI